MIPPPQAKLSCSIIYSPIGCSMGRKLYYRLRRVYYIEPGVTLIAPDSDIQLDPAVRAFMHGSWNVFKCPSFLRTGLFLPPQGAPSKPPSRLFVEDVVATSPVSTRVHAQPDSIKTNLAQWPVCSRRKLIHITLDRLKMTRLSY
jgi:hypothetical protein